MKVILDLDHIVRELGISQDAFAQWKTVNLERVWVSDAISWLGLEGSEFSGQKLLQSQRVEGHSNAEAKIANCGAGRTSKD